MFKNFCQCVCQKPELALNFKNISALDNFDKSRLRLVACAIHGTHFRLMKYNRTDMSFFVGFWYHHHALR